MWHDISQFDIPDRHLRASNSRPRVSMWTDMGEAKITQTIFGRARVRVIREQDKRRRAWLLTALVVIAIAAAAWQGWVAYQRGQNAAPPLSLSERIRAGVPVIQSGGISPPATPPSVGIKPGMPPQTATNNPQSVPLQPTGLKATEQMATKPVTAQPLIASKPQAAPLATNDNAPKNQAIGQQPAKPSVTVQPAAPTVAPFAEPLIKGDTSTLSPAGDNQPSGTASVQP